MLGMYNSRIARKYGLRTAWRVYGLSRAEDVDERYLIEILSRIENPLSEFFLHPHTATESGRQELEALTSDRVRDRLAVLGTALVGYKEKSPIRARAGSLTRSYSS